MPESVTNVEIEDVLSSIRRLVSEEARSEAKRSLTTPEALILTPDTRVHDGRLATPEEAQGLPAQGTARNEVEQDAAFESPFDEATDADLGQQKAPEDKAEAFVPPEAVAVDHAETRAAPPHDVHHETENQHEPRDAALDVDTAQENAPFVNVDDPEGEVDSSGDRSDGQNDFADTDLADPIEDAGSVALDAQAEGRTDSAAHSPIFSSRLSGQKTGHGQDDASSTSAEAPSTEPTSDPADPDGLRPLTSRLSDLEMAVNKSAEDWDPEHDATGLNHDNAPQITPTSEHLENVVVRDVFGKSLGVDEEDDADRSLPEATARTTVEAAAEEAALEALSQEMEAHWRASPPPRLTGDVAPADHAEDTDRGSLAADLDVVQPEDVDPEPLQSDDVQSDDVHPDDIEADGIETDNIEIGHARDPVHAVYAAEAVVREEALDDVGAAGIRTDQDGHHEDAASSDLSVELTPDDIAMPSVGLDEAEDEPEDADFVRAATLFDDEMRGAIADVTQEPVAEAAGATKGSDPALTDALDEDTLRAMVVEIVRQELQGDLGERITRNVRKLVRRELYRAMHTRNFD